MTRLGCLQSPWDHSSLWKQFSFSDASWSSNSWPERSAFIPQESWSVIWLLSKEMAGFISWSLSLMLQIHVSHACCGRTGLWQQTELQTPCCWSDSSTHQGDSGAWPSPACSPHWNASFPSSRGKSTKWILTDLLNYFPGLKTRQWNSTCLFQRQVSFKRKKISSHFSNCAFFYMNKLVLIWRSKQDRWDS